MRSLCSKVMRLAMKARRLLRIWQRGEVLEKRYCLYRLLCYQPERSSISEREKMQMNRYYTVEIVEDEVIERQALRMIMEEKRPVLQVVFEAEDGTVR